MSNICILGSTGTIGVNTLDVISRHPDKYRVLALAANKNVKDMLAQCEQWQPQLVAMADPLAGDALRQQLKTKAIKTEVLSGSESLAIVAALPEVDTVMAAIVGAAGLMPTLAAARAGKRVLLANKEALVMSGALFMQAVRNNNAVLLPIDSEHNAIFQCMPPALQNAEPCAFGRLGIRRILLTGSGGPFRTRERDSLAGVTPEEAVAHPNWVMGRKISVDSATMMNKGLEIIEACWLFNTSHENVQVIVHPQSVIHSMVEYADGSVLAQLGNPDMRTPIAHALAWPARVDSGVTSLDLFARNRFDFEPPDEARFPCLRLARQALDMGGTATAVLNAANEEAVDAFLNRRAGFLQISDLIESALAEIPSTPASGLEAVLAADHAARAHVRAKLH